MLNKDVLKNHYDHLTSKGLYVGSIDQFIHHIKNSSELAWIIKSLKEFIRFHKKGNYNSRTITLKGTKGVLMQKVRYLSECDLTNDELISIGKIQNVMQNVLSRILSGGMSQPTRTLETMVALQSLKHYEKFKRFNEQYLKVYIRDKLTDDDFKEIGQLLKNDSNTKAMFQPYNGKHLPIEWHTDYYQYNKGDKRGLKNVHKSKNDSCEFANSHPCALEGTTDYEKIAESATLYRFYGNRVIYVPLFIVKTLNKKELINRISQTKPIDVIKKSNDISDYGIELTTQLIDLTDPLLQSRIGTYPCRTIHCNHLSCFDLEVFIDYCSSNPKNNRCPHCNHVVHDASELYIDNDIKKLLATHDESTMEKIVFDGKTFQPFKQSNNDKNNKKRKIKQQHSIILINANKKQKTEVPIVYEIIE